MNKQTQTMLDKLQEVDLNCIENKVCCGVMEAYYDAGFDWPLHKPITFNMETGQMKASQWHIKMMPSLSTGKPDSKNQVNIMLNYCPFCGAKLTQESTHDRP